MKISKEQVAVFAVLIVGGLVLFHLLRKEQGAQTPGVDPGSPSEQDATAPLQLSTPSYPQADVAPIQLGNITFATQPTPAGMVYSSPKSTPNPFPHQAASGGEDCPCSGAGDCNNAPSTPVGQVPITTSYIDNQGSNITTIAKPQWNGNTGRGA